MTYDIMLNLQTGDWVFNSVRDYAGTSGDDLITQRIHTRLVIERGSYIFDSKGNLGSDLRSAISSGSAQAKENVAILVKEALAPMTDIIVNEVIVQTQQDDPTIDARAMKVTILWTHDLSEFESGLAGQVAENFSTVII